MVDWVSESAAFGFHQLLSEFGDLLSRTLPSLNAGYIYPNPEMQTRFLTEIENLWNKFETFRTYQFGTWYGYRRYGWQDSEFRSRINLARVLIFENMVMEVRSMIYRIMDTYNKINPEGMARMSTLTQAQKDEIFIFQVKSQAESLVYRIWQWKRDNLQKQLPPQSEINLDIVNMVGKIIGGKIQEIYW